LTYNLFKEIADYCIKNNIKSIIHLGDWFHTRYSINVLSIDISYKIINLLKENNIHIYIIKGNHDQYYKNQNNPHSLLLFKKYDNVTIVDQPLELEDEILTP
jgi:DNA repair exonuclease SbcCD nuclease subunit